MKMQGFPLAKLDPFPIPNVLAPSKKVLLRQADMIILTFTSIDESSKFLKSRTLEILILKLAVGLQNLYNFNFKWSIVLNRIKTENKQEGSLKDSYISCCRMTVRVMGPLLVEATTWLRHWCSQLWMAESQV